MFLLTEANNLYGRDLNLKGQYMEIFHFLSGSPHAIYYSPTIMQKNMDELRNLILNMKFVPFPPQKVKETAQYINDLVLQGAILILLPPVQTIRWTIPDKKVAIERFQELIDLGFQLNYKIILNIFQLFEPRLNNVEIKKEKQEDLLCKCLKEMMNPTYKPNNTIVQEFIYTNLARTPDKKFANEFSNSGVIKSIIGEISNKQNEAKAYSIIISCWLIGFIVGLIINNPYLLPCLIVAFIILIGVLTKYFKLKEIFKSYKDDENVALLTRNNPYKRETVKMSIFNISSAS
ncbi:4491_t:CDS:2 [Scutellospora calospora]|uniref:4491_t:CDS:1 n=1 Tax=Scutellospora calospora TaxID=85575 RepID=A0ACA9KJJ4_9GLOM|nr:4491_t:CDS:2 [Scutellospora calospora]